MYDIESFLISICESDLHLLSNSLSDNFINTTYKHRYSTYGSIKAELGSKNGHKNLKPIHLACDKGNAEVVERLLMLECNIDVYSKIGNSPLHVASSRGHWEVVAMLIRQGCLVDTVNEQKETALHLAAKENHSKVAKILLFSGINVQKINATKQTSLQMAEANGNESVSTIIREWIKFHKILNDKHEGKFKGILKHPGFKKFYINNNICTEEIITYIKVIDRYKSVEQFVKELRFYHYIRIHQNEDALMHADIEEVNKIFDQNGGLVYCLNNKDLCPQFCNHLMQLMLDMDKIEENLKRMLRIIAKFSNKSIEMMIQKRQQFVSVKRRAFWNRLHLAVSDDRCDMIEYLLVKHMVNVNATDEIGNSPLFIACIYGRMECAKVLLCHGADINTKNKYGQSLFQVAIENGMEEFIVPIVDKVTTVESVDVLGHSILDIAVKFASEDLYEKLLIKCKDFDNEIQNSPTLGYIANERNLNNLLSISLKENTASLYLKVKGYISPTLISKMSKKSLEILDESQNSLLHLAAWNISYETCESLIKNGANVNLKNMYGNTPLHEVINRFLFDNAANVDDSLLFTVRVLLQSEADVNLSNESQETPLQLALQSFNKQLMKEIILNSGEIVLNHVDFERILSSKFSDIIYELISKLTPECASSIITENVIEKYIRDLDSNVTELLIEKTSPKIRKSILVKPLSGEDQKNNIEFLLNSLLKYEGELRNELNGETVLTYFIKMGKAFFSEEIVSSTYSDSLVNVKNSQNQSALHIAIEKGYLTLAEHILSISKVCDDKDNQGNTPLGILLRKWTINENKTDLSVVCDLAKAFIRKRANINSQNYDGKIVIDECHHIKVKKKLQKLYKKYQSTNNASS